MIAHVGSNFVLETHSAQEQVADAEELLALAASRPMDLRSQRAVAPKTMTSATRAAAVSSPNHCGMKRSSAGIAASVCGAGVDFSWVPFRDALELVASASHRR
jgi:hypothetical protein